MSIVTDSLFGGAQRKAAKADIAATEKAMAEYKRGVAQAKEEINPRFASAAQKLEQGTGGAIDALSGAFAPSLDVMSQGNLNAQSSLASAGQQGMNAILGNQMDYSALQPQGIDFDPSEFLSGMPSLPQEEENPYAALLAGSSELGNYEPPEESPFARYANMGFGGGYRAQQREEPQFTERGFGGAYSNTRKAQAQAAPRIPAGQEPREPANKVYGGLVGRTVGKALEKLKEQEQAKPSKAKKSNTGGRMGGRRGVTGFSKSNR